PALGSVGLTHMLTVESDYPAETLISVLNTAGLSCTCTMPLDERLRYLPLTAVRDEDTAYLLRAAGIAATVFRQPIVTLYNLTDAQFKTVRDALCCALEKDFSPLSSPELPADACDGFLALTASERVARAAKLGIALPAPCLDAIADDYLNRVGRNPMPDELRLLDNAYRSACADPAVCAPIALYTDDARVHTLYADLMEKRRAVAPDVNAPATFSELAETAPRYLCALRGNPLPLPRRVCAAPGEADVALAAVGAAPIGGYMSTDQQIECLLADSPVRTSAPLPGDRLLFVTPGNMNFAEALRQFFAAAAVNVRQSLTVKPGWLLSALGRVLSSTGYGLRIFPDRQEVQTPADRLWNKESGVLLVCAENAGGIIPAALKSAGLRFTVLAAVTRENTVTTGNGTDGLNISAAMFAPRPAVTAEIHAPIPGMPTQGFSPLTQIAAELASHTGQSYSPLLADRLAQEASAVQLCDRELLSAVCCIPGNDPLGEVRDAALGLIARLIAAGAQIEQITLSVTAELPMHANDAVGQSLAALLGLYWVQIEQGIVAERPRLIPAKMLRIRLAATAPAGKTPSVPHPGQTLYLLSPHSLTGRLDGEYALFRHISSLDRTQPVFTAACSGLSPAAAAAYSAEQNQLGLQLADQLPAEKQPAGILISADTPPTVPAGIDVCPIGTFTAEQGIRTSTEQLDAQRITSILCGTLPAPVPSGPKTTMPPRPSRHRIARPRVLLPFTGHRPDEVQSIISALGGECIAVPLDLSTPDSVRRTISDWAEMLDRVQIVLLQERRAISTVLLSHRRGLDAVTRFIAADGLLAACSGGFAAALTYGILAPEQQATDIRLLTGQRQLCAETISTTSPWFASRAVGHKQNTLLTAPPVCPDLSPETYSAWLAGANILAVASGTPDGRPAITAIASADGNLLGQCTPIARDQLAAAIAYFA
ncbi:MAG: hypothetical protein IKL84_05150, partial [Clostridia bacterium]|nr:hypothetical protein [Clostridia bacterium]